MGLAAMVGVRINMHENHLKAAFRRFEVDNSGFITTDNLREVLGETYEGEHVESLLHEADLLNHGQVSYPEFVAYLTGQPLEGHADAAANIVDNQLDKMETVSVTSASGFTTRMMLK